MPLMPFPLSTVYFHFFRHSRPYHFPPPKGLRCGEKEMERTQAQTTYGQWKRQIGQNGKRKEKPVVPNHHQHVDSLTLMQALGPLSSALLAVSRPSTAQPEPCTSSWLGWPLGFEAMGNEVFNLRFVSNQRFHEVPYYCKAYMVEECCVRQRASSHGVLLSGFVIRHKCRVRLLGLVLK